MVDAAAAAAAAAVPIDRPRGGRCPLRRPVGELARIDILSALGAFAPTRKTNSSSLPTSIITSAPSCAESKARIDVQVHGKGAERRVHVRKVGEYKPPERMICLTSACERRQRRRIISRGRPDGGGNRVSVSGTMDAAWAAFNAGQGWTSEAWTVSLERRRESARRGAARVGWRNTRREILRWGDIREERDVTRA